MKVRRVNWKREIKGIGYADQITQQTTLTPDVKRRVPIIKHSAEQRGRQPTEESFPSPSLGRIRPKGVTSLGVMESLTSAQWCQHVKKVSGPVNTSKHPNLSEVCFLALFLWL